MRRAGISTQRASPWPKSASTGHSELHTCHRVQGLGLSVRDHGSIEDLLELPKRQFRLPLDSSVW